MSNVRLPPEYTWPPALKADHESAHIVVMDDLWNGRDGFALGDVYIVPVPSPNGRGWVAGKIEVDTPDDAKETELYKVDMVAHWYTQPIYGQLWNFDNSTIDDRERADARKTTLEERHQAKEWWESNKGRLEHRRRKVAEALVKAEHLTGRELRALLRPMPRWRR